MLGRQRSSGNEAAAGMHELKLDLGITTSEDIDRHRLGTKSENRPKDKDSQRKSLLRHHRLRSQEEVLKKAESQKFSDRPRKA